MKTIEIEEVNVDELLEEVFSGNINVTWTPLNNNTQDIRNLSDSHAANLSFWLRDRNANRARKIIQAELERRATGNLPNNFEDLCKSYMAKPETWRMKIHL